MAQRFGGADSFAIDPVQVGLMRGGGTPLASALLARMEAAFGADFSAVRVHVGPQAPRIGALAFTTGNDLYFAPGQYQPDSVRGQQLIGHELAHVIQQRQGRVRAPASGVAVVQDRALEAEADRLGIRAAAYRAPVPPSSARAVQPKSQVARRPLPPQRPFATGTRGAAIQRVPTSEAKELIDGWSYKPGWYEHTFVPVLEAIATKANKTYDQLIQEASIGDLYGWYKHLKIDPYEFPSFDFDFHNKTIFEKSQYPSMVRVRGKEIYVNSNLDSRHDKAIESWRKQVESGSMVWYRGLPTTHFTYAVLHAKHILVGDGVEDKPTFTMGPPTRWIPGDQDKDTCAIFASYVNEQDGLQEILARIDLVVGVILAMRVDPTANPIAYLTASEQVIRTPIREENVKIAQLVFRGPSGLQIRPFSKSLWHLPPPLPYQGKKKDPKMIEALTMTLRWMETSGLLPRGDTERQLEKVYSVTSLASLDLAGQVQSGTARRVRSASLTL